MLVGITRHSQFLPFFRNQFDALTEHSRLTSCSFQFMFGKLYHLFSVKHVFLASVVIFEIGSLVAGVSPTSAALVLGRAISGMGCAGIISGVFTFVCTSMPVNYPFQLTRGTIAW